jgi:UDP-N-acetylmuramoyl-tripeptide--D-alanyl-D-alanine ligase
MMAELRLTDAALAFGGTLLNPDCVFTQVSIDSRQISEGQLFVALEGERFDAHEFLEEVTTLACGLVVSKPNKNLPIPQWVVDDTTEALGQLAHMNRELLNGPLIAITGSSGKTSVKEMIASILSQESKVHATQGNLNNHIGVPLTLLSMQADTDFAVIEMGASAIGEIAYLCDIARPDVTLVNNIQHAHIEGFGSIEGVATAKSEIYRGLKPSGTAVINLDLAWSDAWLTELADKRCLTFSTEHKNADVVAENISVLDTGCCQFDLCNGKTRKSVTLPVPGTHSVKNAIAAAACCIALGVPLDQIVMGLTAVKPVAGRLNLRQLTDNVALFDDTYNANPDSFKAAIDVLANAEGYRLLVMGDMAELGDKAMEMHSEIGRYAAEKGIEALYSVGVLSAVASDAFGGNHFSDKQTLMAALDDVCANKLKVTLLVKGSRSSGMEEVVTMLSNKEKS